MLQRQKTIHSQPKTVKSNPNTLEIAAYHEAGHAVFYYLYGYAIQSLSADVSGSGLTECRQFRPTHGMHLNVFKDVSVTQLKEIKSCLFADIERYSKISIAGYAAEYKYLGKKMPNSIIAQPDPTHDYSKIWTEFNMANKVLNEEICNSLMLWLHQEDVKKEIRKPKVWQTIQELATAVIAAPGNIIFKQEIKYILKKKLVPYDYEKLNFLLPPRELESTY